MLNADVNLLLLLLLSPFSEPRFSFLNDFEFD